MISKSGLINLLQQVNQTSKKAIDRQGPARIATLFTKQCAEIFKYLNCDFTNISAELESITIHYTSDPTIPEWIYIISIIFLLTKLKDHLKNNSDEALLSVKENATVKATITSLTIIGINSKLIEELPTRMEKKFVEDKYVQNDRFYNYNILRSTILALCDFLRRNEFRTPIVSCSLQSILVGLYEIGYAPLSRNIQDPILSTLLTEKTMALKLLGELQGRICSTIYIRDTMVIFYQNAPRWFKSGISKTLSTTLITPNGLEQIINAMFSVLGGKSMHLVVQPVIKLLLHCGKLNPDFDKQVPYRMYELMEKYEDDKNLLYELLFSEYLKFTNFKGCTGTDRLLCDLKLCTEEMDGVNRERNVTNDMKHTIRRISAFFTEETIDNQLKEKLKPYFNVLFRIFCITSSQSGKSDPVLKTINKQCRTILCKCIKHENQGHDIELFDNLVFNFADPEILLFEPHLILMIRDKHLVIKNSEHVVTFPISDRIDLMMNLFLEHDILLKRFFLYLLNCLNNKEKYFVSANDSLLSIEEDGAISEYFQRRLAVYKTLSSLAEHQTVQKIISKSPTEIIEFIDNVLKNSLKDNTHMLSNDSDEFNSFFSIILILNSLVENRKNIKKFKDLIEPLQLIASQTHHTELSTLIKSILNHILNTKNDSDTKEIQKTPLDIIVEDIYDPCIPTRAHGLVELKKLVEAKNADVMARKQFVLILFQQNLKDKESYLYLHAINGLAALADVFTDTVLPTLCQEYSEFPKSNSTEKNEIRMKVGEVLVKTTKILGEMAPKYKALLLNTFLNGTKDSDHLIRCSNLSNLGEICRILGYKVGSVITEILVCIHAIITTDKAIEARRAAVTVIKQLLTGLENEMIAYLKDDILPIYRTLKNIYAHDKDDVMKLQAQLALEELNENMRNFVFSEPQLLNIDMQKIVLK